MINFQDGIFDDVSRCMLWDGYVFTAITSPANVYDAIVIKYPHNIPCFSPYKKGSLRSLQEQIDFINGCGIEKALIISDDISFITQCPGLKHLDIIPSDNSGDGFDYSPLYEMPLIKSLGCSVVYGFREEFSTSIDCSKIKGLEFIHINDPRMLNYSNINSLKDLGLSNYKGKDLSEAFNSPILDTITVIQSKIKTLDGIEKSKRMQCVYLYYNRNLQDISALKKIGNTVKALRIENCPQIKDFSFLSDLEELEHLFLLGNNNLPSLSFLNNMKNLKTFILGMNVLDGDITPCMDLSYAYCRNRRHYNLKDEDLPKGIYIRGNENIDEWRRRM